jgi:hypothetical protein
LRPRFGETKGNGIPGRIFLETIRLNAVGRSVMPVDGESQNDEEESQQQNVHVTCIPGRPSGYNGPKGASGIGSSLKQSVDA